MFYNDYKSMIKYVLLDRPHLEPIFYDDNGFIKRLRKYSPHSFLVWNKISNNFEIHSLLSFMPRFMKWTTYQFSWYEYPDERVLVYMEQNDIKLHGNELFKKLEYENDLYFQHKKELTNHKIKTSINEVMRTAKGYNSSF